MGADNFGLLLSDHFFYATSIVPNGIFPHDATALLMRRELSTTDLNLLQVHAPLGGKSLNSFSIAFSISLLTFSGLLEISLAATPRQTTFFV